MPKFLDVTDKSAARAVLGADGGGTVNVGDYRNGVRTDNEIIAAAFADLESGGCIRFEQGRTYTISGAIDCDLTGLDNVLVDGQGATLDAPVMTGRVFTVRGTEAATTTTLTAAVTDRIRTLSVASSAGFAAGDVVLIISDTELFNNERDYYFKQDVARVESVGSGTIVLDAPTWNSYSISGGATVTVTRYDPVRNLKIRDLSFTGPGTGLNQFGLTIRYFDGVDISNVRVDGVGTQGISANDGIDLKVSNCSFFNCNQDSYGYGVIAGSVHSVKFINCYGSNNRHSFDVDSSRDILFLGCTAEGDKSSGLSTHGNTDMTKIVNCTARDCGGGIIVRGRNNLIQGNSVIGTRLTTDTNQTYKSGIRMSSELGGTDLWVLDNYIDVSGPDQSSEASYAFNCETSINNARIMRNYFGGGGTHVMNIQGPTNTNLQIADNYIDCSSQEAGLAAGFHMGILIYDQSAGSGNNSTGIDIERNVITGALHSGIRIHGSDSASPVTDDVRIHHNRIGACGTNAIATIYGYFGSNVQVYANETETINSLGGTYASPATTTSPDFVTSDVQVFTGNGTWTKPANAVSVRVRCIGPGGGGGAGARGPSGTALSGGGGGAAGGMSEMTFAASDLSSSVSVIVGAGGVGASGQTSNDSAGAAGSASAANTLFGSYLAAFRGGPGGGGGLASAATGGSGQSAGYSYGINDGATGGGGSASGAAGTFGARVGGSAGGGGGGGGITTAPAATAGGVGGVTMSNPLLAVGASGSGAAGGNGSPSTVKGTGSGGGGGGGNTGGAGYDGGDGGNYGAGGGGGGASLNGSTSGGGGDGGDGICIVTTYF